jgi:hypothetical protein
MSHAPTAEAPTDAVADLDLCPVCGQPMHPDHALVFLPGPEAETLGHARCLRLRPAAQQVAQG